MFKIIAALVNKNIMKLIIIGLIYSIKSCSCLEMCFFLWSDDGNLKLWETRKKFNSCINIVHVTDSLCSEKQTWNSSEFNAIKCLKKTWMCILEWVGLQYIANDSKLFECVIKAWRKGRDWLISIYTLKLINGNSRCHNCWDHLVLHKQKNSKKTGYLLLSISICDIYSCCDPRCKIAHPKVLIIISLLPISLFELTFSTVHPYQLISTLKYMNSCFIDFWEVD